MILCSWLFILFPVIQMQFCSRGDPGTSHRFGRTSSAELRPAVCPYQVLFRSMTLHFVGIGVAVRTHQGLGAGSLTALYYSLVLTTVM